ncbi:hypothetical protein [uncultured Tenacibaculum sp.]|uniref:hypothetical protein n=1 Tax=uncultured Tenacibaculum sp. TaxID=174713 RepID=UPI00262F684C|nr:hypothetical protein [uncultured Tenacibaculum sp.]
MKKVFLTIAMLTFGFAISAQNSNEKKTNTQTEKGKFIIEANTGSNTTGNTGFYLRSTDGNTSFAVGLDGGYFFMDNFAVKTGLGYNDGNEAFVYKIGAEYYIEGQFPVGIDFTGTSFSGGSENWIGVQGGYAYFIGDKVSIKPTVRYNIGLDDGQKGVFQGLIGFALYL